MEPSLIRLIALLAFVISLAGVGAYIDIITRDRVNNHKAYTSLVILLTVGMFTIVFLLLLSLCCVINFFL